MSKEKQLLGHQADSKRLKKGKLVRRAAHKGVLSYFRRFEKATLNDFQIV